MSLPRVFFISLLVAALLGAAGCATDPFALSPVPTRTIEFRADKEINHGLLLPVDIVYVSYLHQLRQLTSLGPDQWFNSELRARWLDKQSLGIRGGEHRRVRLQADLAARSPFIVVFAAFMGVSDPAPQQVILNDQAWPDEVILVHPHSLESLNPALRTLE